MTYRMKAILAPIFGKKCHPGCYQFRGDFYITDVDKYAAYCTIMNGARKQHIKNGRSDERTSATNS